jgi:MFS-type transporter involved in bile tolerance (Atg22 family)
LFLLSSEPSALGASLLLVAATVLLTAGELLSSAGSWGLSYGLAVPERQGEYLGAFGLISQAAQVAGPALAALVVGAGGLAWLAVGALFVVAGLATPLTVARSRR